MQAINFRPKVDPRKLREIAKKQHYSDLSGFINDAIEEKLRHINESPKDHKLVSSIKKAKYTNTTVGLSQNLPLRKRRR